MQMIVVIIVNNINRVVQQPDFRSDNAIAFRRQVKRYKSFSSKEKQIWAIRGKKTKAKENIRKRPCLIQRKNEN